MFWTPPKLWPGGTCYIIGGGPSVGKLEPEKLRGQRIIVINNAYKLFPFADVLFFADSKWFYWHEESLMFFRGLRVSVSENLNNRPGIKVVHGSKGVGLSAPQDRLCWGNNSGYGAIALAVKFGVKKIILMGFDMRPVGGRNNYHKEHEREVPPSTYEEKMLPSFNTLAPALEKIEVEVVNATPDSALKIWPICSPEEVYPNGN